MHSPPRRALPHRIPPGPHAVGPVQQTLSQVRLAAQQSEQAALRTHVLESRVAQLEQQFQQNRPALDRLLYEVGELRAADAASLEALHSWMLGETHAVPLEAPGAAARSEEPRWAALPRSPRPLRQGSGPPASDVALEREAEWRRNLEQAKVLTQLGAAGPPAAAAAAAAGAGAGAGAGAAGDALPPAAGDTPRSQLIGTPRAPARSAAGSPSLGGSPQRGRPPLPPPHAVLRWRSPLRAPPHPDADPVAWDGSDASTSAPPTPPGVAHSTRSLSPVVRIALPGPVPPRAAEAAAAELARRLGYRPGAVEVLPPSPGGSELRLRFRRNSGDGVGSPRHAGRAARSVAARCSSPRDPLSLFFGLHGAVVEGGPPPPSPRPPPAGAALRPPPRPAPAADEVWAGPGPCPSTTPPVPAAAARPEAGGEGAQEVPLLASSAPGPALTSAPDFSATQGAPEIVLASLSAQSSATEAATAATLRDTLTGAPLGRGGSTTSAPRLCASAASAPPPIGAPSSVPGAPPSSPAQPGEGAEPGQQERRGRERAGSRVRPRTPSLVLSQGSRPRPQVSQPQPQVPPTSPLPSQAAAPQQPPSAAAPRQRHSEPDPMHPYLFADGRRAGDSRRRGFAPRGPLLPAESELLRRADTLLEHWARGGQSG